MSAWRTSDEKFLPRRPIRSLSIRKAAVATVWIASSSSLAKNIRIAASSCRLAATTLLMCRVAGGECIAALSCAVSHVARKVFEPGLEQPSVSFYGNIGLTVSLDPDFKMARGLDGPR